MKVEARGLSRQSKHTWKVKIKMPKFHDDLVKEDKCTSSTCIFKFCKREDCPSYHRESTCKLKNDKGCCDGSINGMQCIYTNRSTITREEECGMFEKKDKIEHQMKVI
jgi:hypothetical protein